MDSKKRGARLGKYSLVAEIARGGMGVVYLAQAIGPHGFTKLVVVKQLKPELAEDDKFRDMFLDEARLAARLNHRNIVQTLEVDQDGDRYFFVMEYLEGRTLHSVSRLKGDKALPVPTILRIICDVLAGLHYAHELADYDGTPLGVVHRDVSPRNVFLTYDGQVKLLDFGVAKSIGHTQETQAGELKGRVPYMAPEHVSEKTIDRRADIFSVGVLLREALTRTRVWEGFSEVEILRDLLLRRIPPLDPDSGLPEDAVAIIEKAMAPERDDRYRTAHEMRIALEQYVSRIDKSGSFARLGDHISAEFAEQRAQVKSMIEHHVARAEDAPPDVATGDLPTLPLSAPDLHASKPSGASARTAAAPTSSPSRPTRAAVPSSSTPLSTTTTPTDAKKSAAITAAAEAVAAPAPPKEISLPPPAPKRGIGTWIVFTLLFGGLVAGGTAAILSTREPPSSKLPLDLPPLPVMSEHPKGDEPDGATEATDTVEVTVHATPPVSQLYVDYVFVGQGPHTAKYKIGTVHVIRALAPGYVPKSETVTVTSTTSINLVLEREAGAASAKRPVAPPPPRAPAPAPPSTEPK
jgi:eukaryotic-like serine/threonine-protein kinase